MVAHVVGPPAVRRMTRAEYHRLGEIGFFGDERVQLIHGSVVTMPPIGPPHSSAVGSLAELFSLRLAGRAKVRVQQPFVARDESEPEPDVALVPVGDYRAAHPEVAFVLIEVAESSLEYDRTTKASLYAASNVPEYWVVDVVGRTVEVMRDPAGDVYRTVRRFGAGERLSPAAFPDAVVAVDDLFA